MSQPGQQGGAISTPSPILSPQYRQNLIGAGMSPQMLTQAGLPGTPPSPQYGQNLAAAGMDQSMLRQIGLLPSQQTQWNQYGLTPQQLQYRQNLLNSGMDPSMVNPAFAQQGRANIGQAGRTKG